MTTGYSAPTGRTAAAAAPVLRVELAMWPGAVRRHGPPRTRFRTTAV
ncbi:hypothetical protein ABZY44_23040 [Streptomyces sp. NPDC006544]